jgi:3-hydroxybutyryl-CoA dehydrogenase
VIETVLEDLALKQELIAKLETWVRDGAVIATNTSSLPVETLASTLAEPGRFAAFHFLNPAESTTVVEIVPGSATTPETVSLLVELARRMEKTPLVLRRDYPGFVWNRLQMAMIRECLHLLDEGVADIEAIEAAVSDGLAPRWMAAGPLATSDLGGSGTFLRVAEQLFPRLASGAEVSGRLGTGFFEWTDETSSATRELRAATLHAGRGFAKRRRATAPDPRQGN